MSQLGFDKPIQKKQKKNLRHKKRTKDSPSGPRRKSTRLSSDSKTVSASAAPVARNPTEAKVGAEDTSNVSKAVVTSVAPVASVPTEAKVSAQDSSKFSKTGNVSVPQLASEGKLMETLEGINAASQKLLSEEDIRSFARTTRHGFPGAGLYVFCLFIHCLAVKNQCLTMSSLLRRHRSNSAKDIKQDVEMKDLDSGDEDHRPVYYVEEIREVKRDGKGAGKALIKWSCDPNCTWEPIGNDLGGSCKSTVPFCLQPRLSD